MTTNQRELELDAVAEGYREYVKHLFEVAALEASGNSEPLKVINRLRSGLATGRMMYDKIIAVILE